MSSVETSGNISVTKKRRSSVHKNLFDSNLYSIPNRPNSVYQERKAQKLLNAQHGSNLSAWDQVKQSWNGLLDIIPNEYKNQYKKDFWPEIDTKVALLCIVWYISSSTSSNLAKSILKRFVHPVAFTELQFLVSAIICLGFTCIINFLRKPNLRNSEISRHLNNFPEGILPTYLNGDFRSCIIETFSRPSKLILMTTFPLGIFQFIGHTTSHKATSLVSISLVHSIKSLSPIVTVAYYSLFENKKYNRITYYTLLLLVTGVMLTCWSSHGNSKSNNSVTGAMILLGIMYAFVSMMIFVTQNIFAKNVLTVKLNKNGILSNDSVRPSKINDKQYTSNVQIDKITILFYCSCIGFLLTLGPFLTNELIHGYNIRQDLTLSVFLLILIHGITHFIQAMLAFQLLGLLSSVNYSVANIMKRIVIIIVALIWESKLNFTQFIGLFLTITGLYGYDKWGVSRRESRQL